jgi:hypothetical protein
MSEEAVATSTTSESAPSAPVDGGYGSESASPSSIISGGQVNTPPDLSFSPQHLPDGLSEEPSLQNFDSVDKLAKSYAHLVKKMGVPADQLLRLPEAGQPMDDVYNALGRPESHEEYNIGDYDPDTTADFRQLAHEIGLNNDQASVLFDTYVNAIAGQQEQEQQAFDQFEVENTQALQQEWGGNFDKNVELARRAFMNFATPEAVEIMEQTGLGNHPEILKVFSRVGELLQEDSVLPGSSTPILGGMNPAQAQETFNSKMADTEFRNAYLDGYHPNHAKAVEEMTKLHSYMG